MDAAMEAPPVVEVEEMCFDSLSEAMGQRSFNGWFSFVVQQEGPDADAWCIHPYRYFEWLFVLCLAIMAVLSILTCLGVLYTFVRRRLNRCFQGSSVVDLEAPTAVTAVIPCFLPNEQEIIEETVEWILTRVNWAGSLTVLVVYNTPTDLPDIEQRLQTLQDSGSWPDNRSLRVMRVRESTSKAANLNAALKIVDDPHVVIYDADHHPDPDSLQLLWQKMQSCNADCVQGSYYMRNLSQNQFGCSPCAFPCLARIIDAEFFVDWTFMKLVTSSIFLGNGYFSGSNALWKTEVLASRDFSVSAQTEDVDMAIQQLLDGRRIEFCPESASGELAPMSCAAMWKQRLRWTIGWDETSLKHAASFALREGLTFRERFGLTWTFIVRWLITIVTFGAVYVGMPLTMMRPLQDMYWGKLITFLGRVCVYAGCAPWFLSTIEAALRIPQRGCQGFVQMLFVFVVASPVGFVCFFFFNLLLQLVSCMRLSTGTVAAWEVTQRSHDNKAARSLGAEHAHLLPKLTEVMLEETLEKARACKSGLPLLAM